MPTSKNSRSALEARRLADVLYLANRVIAHTYEARVILAKLPTLRGDEQWRLMHQFLSRIAPGNSEAERIFRLEGPYEPYTHGVTATGAPLVMDAVALWPDANAQRIAEQIWGK